MTTSRRIVAIVAIATLLTIAGLTGCSCSQQNQRAGTPPSVKKYLSPAEAFKSNMDSWLNHTSTKDRAQMELAPQYEKVVRDLIEERFTDHDSAVVEVAGRRIYDIAGDRATAIILEYVNDPRVIMAKNAQWWYTNYCPGAIFNRIDAKSTSGTNRISMAPVALAPTAPPTPRTKMQLCEDIARLKAKIRSTERDLALCREEIKNASSANARYRAQKDAANDKDALDELWAQLRQKTMELEKPSY